MTEGLRVKPITYNLDIGRELMNPSFQVRSGSFSQMLRTEFDQDVKLDRKEKGSVFIEVCDGDELVGKGEITFNTLSNREGMFNEWIPLMDNSGKQVGQALVEIEISPEAGKIHTGKMYKGLMDEMRDVFGDAGKDMLPAQDFPSIKGAGTGMGFGDESNDGQMGIDNPNPDLESP